MLVLGGLGEMWLYPNEVIGNDVQDEGWGLFYQYSGAQKIKTNIMSFFGEHSNLCFSEASSQYLSSLEAQKRSCHFKKEHFSPVLHI